MSRRKCPAIAILILLILSICGTGCGGMHLGNTLLNLPLPESFAKRRVWPDPSIFQYKLEELPGHVIYKYKETAHPDSPRYSLGPKLLKDSYEIKAEPVKDGAIYSSKIDSGASAQASYLAFAGKLSEESAMEVVITDIALALVKAEDIPASKLRMVPWRPDEERCWVQGVLLTHVLHKAYTKVDASLSGVVGDVFGAKGNVYHAVGGFTRDAVIALLCIDIDKFVDNYFWEHRLMIPPMPPYKTGRLRELTKDELAERLAEAAEAARVSDVVMSPLIAK